MLPWTWNFIKVLIFNFVNVSYIYHYRKLPRKITLLKSSENSDEDLFSNEAITPIKFLFQGSMNKSQEKKVHAVCTTRRVQAYLNVHKEPSHSVHLVNWKQLVCTSFL